MLRSIASLSMTSGAVWAAMCHGNGPDEAGYTNLEPIHSQNLQFIREFSDPEIGGAAKYYMAGEQNDKFNVVHVWGNPYQLGYNHGAILKDQIIAFYDGVYDYFIEEAHDEACQLNIDPISKACIIRPDVIDNILEHGVDKALDMELEATDPYTSDYFEEEMQGLADATGYDLQRIRRIHQLGELTKASCSMVGAWDEALSDKKGLLQLRALDWTTAAIFVNNPQMTVYHPEDQTNNRFANIGFPGWIGLMTGMNDQKMGISEIGAGTAGDSPDFPDESRKGQSFTWMLRDILQFDKTADQAKERMEKADRTCNLILGVGDGKTNVFHGFASDAGRLTTYNDKDMEPLKYIDGTDMRHDRIDNIVYWGMDWYCWQFHEVLRDNLLEYWGDINFENLIRSILAGTNSGNLHVTVMDYNQDDMYVAFHSKKDQELALNQDLIDAMNVGCENDPNAVAEYGASMSSAWKRSYTRLRMAEIFAEKSPLENYDDAADGAVTSNVTGLTLFLGMCAVLAH